MVIDSYETATGEIAKIRWKKRKKVTSVHRLWLHWHHDKLSVFLRGHWTFEIILPAIIGLIDDGRMSVAFFASTSEKMKLPMNVEKKNIGKMSITETHAQRADQTLKANTRKRKVASAGGWRQVPKSDPHYQELVYIVPTSLPYPPLDSTIYKIKNFLYSRFHSAVPPNLQGQTTQVITNKWSEVNKTQSPN